MVTQGDDMSKAGRASTKRAELCSVGSASVGVLGGAGLDDVWSQTVLRALQGGVAKNIRASNEEARED